MIYHYFIISFLGANTWMVTIEFQLLNFHQISDSYCILVESLKTLIGKDISLF